MNEGVFCPLHSRLRPPTSFLGAKRTKGGQKGKEGRTIGVGEGSKLAPSPTPLPHTKGTRGQEEDKIRRTTTLKRFKKGPSFPPVGSREYKVAVPRWRVRACGGAWRAGEGLAWVSGLHHHLNSTPHHAHSSPPHPLTLAHHGNACVYMHKQTNTHIHIYTHID